MRLCCLPEQMFFGHGIGKTFHEGPMVAHKAEPGSGVALREGMIFTIEPMLNYGGKTVSSRKHTMRVEFNM